jgi:hypothetical protein
MSDSGKPYDGTSAEAAIDHGTRPQVEKARTG